MSFKTNALSKVFFFPFNIKQNHGLLLLPLLAGTSYRNSVFVFCTHSNYIQPIKLRLKPSLRLNTQTQEAVLMFSHVHSLSITAPPLCMLPLP